MTNNYTLEKTPQLPSSLPSSPLASLPSTPRTLYSIMGISVGCFSFSATPFFLLFFFPRLQHGVLHRPPSSQRHSSSWVSTCRGVPCRCIGLAFFSGVFCPDWLLPIGPVSLKPVARPYPKPNHSPSSVKNVLLQASLSPAKSFPGFVYTVSVLVSAEKGGKLSSKHRKNRSLNFTSVPGCTCCSR